MFGKNVSSVGRYPLNFTTDNLALITVDSDSFPALVETYQVSRSERVQVVTCFNDAIYIYAFGKQPVSISINGFSLLSNNGLANLIQNYKSKYRAYNSVSSPFKVITSRGESLTGICRGFAYSASSEMPALVRFSMDIIGIDEDTKMVAK